MRLVKYKRMYRLRDDAHTSDYMVMLDELMQDIDCACTDILAHGIDDPRESDIELKFNGDTYILPFSFLSEMINSDYIKAMIDNLHRGTEDRVYMWPLDETIIRPKCKGCGECEKRNRSFYIGTACMYKYIEVNPSDMHRESCEKHFKEKYQEDLK